MSGGPGGNIYLLSIGFNQDYSCFSCGTTGGFRVFTLSPFQEAHRRESSNNQAMKPFKLCTMLFKTNLFLVAEATNDGEGAAAVPVDSHFRVCLWDDSRKKYVGEIRSRHSVKGIYMSRDIICVVSEYNIYIYLTSNLSILYHITTVGNPKGICALVSDSSPWVLACPGSSIGSVRIQVGTSEEGSIQEFTAHKTSLAHITATMKGEMFATASETGTVIKVFDRGGHCLHELRRGTTPTQISCLTFRRDNKFLAAASASATIHIFELYKEETSAEHAATQNISDAITAAMPKYFHPGRAAAIFRIPDQDHSDLRAGANSNLVGPLVCFAPEGNVFYVLHYTGLLYEVKYDVEGKPAPSQLSRVVSQMPASEHLSKVFGEEECNCSIVDTTTWFASRPEFNVYCKDRPRRKDDQEECEDDWNVL